MLTMPNIRGGGGTPQNRKERKRHSYLYDVAVQENISTLAGKRHYTHYFDTGKHALSTKLFQILQRPTQQSCTSRFLTEGNPDVIRLYLVKLRSSNAKRLPSACFNTADEEMLEVTWYLAVWWEFISTPIALHTQEDAVPADGAQQERPNASPDTDILRCIINWSMGFQIQVEKGFCFYRPASGTLPASII